MRFDPVECGKRMKALRESKNLTQMQLAEQLNISLNHVKALEHARRLFSIDLVIETLQHPERHFLMMIDNFAFSDPFQSRHGVFSVSL